MKPLREMKEAQRRGKAGGKRKREQYYMHSFVSFDADWKADKAYLIVEKNKIAYH